MELLPGIRERRRQKREAQKVGASVVVFARGVKPTAGTIPEGGLWWNDKPKLPAVMVDDHLIIFGPAWTSIELNADSSSD